jgi:cytoskeletal protein CcmA (bactofilin family)
MKAHRYLHLDRHLDQDQENRTMNDTFDPQQNAAPHEDNSQSAQAGEYQAQAEASATHMEVDVGNAMPPSQPSSLPLLQPETSAVPYADASDTGSARSMVAEGMRFVGNAELRGPCSIGGHVEGNIKQAPHAQVAVVVTETGRVKGDITAHKISVMGHTDGILDSGQGEVALHDTASVHGLVRYGRIQVNGADLNATLERATPTSPPR